MSLLKQALHLKMNPARNQEREKHTKLSVLENIMNKKIFIGLFFSLALFFTGSASAQTVSGSIAKGTVKRGATARGTVVLSIPGGLHTNSWSGRTHKQTD